MRIIIHHSVGVAGKLLLIGISKRTIRSDRLIRLIIDDDSFVSLNIESIDHSTKLGRIREFKIDILF